MITLSDRIKGLKAINYNIFRNFFNYSLIKFEEKDSYGSLKFYIII